MSRDFHKDIIHCPYCSHIVTLLLAEITRLHYSLLHQRCQDNKRQANTPVCWSKTSQQIKKVGRQHPQQLHSISCSNKSFASNISQVPKKEVSLKYISANRVEPEIQPSVKYARNTYTNTKTNIFVFLCKKGGALHSKRWSMRPRSKYAPKMQQKRRALVSRSHNFKTSKWAS